MTMLDLPSADIDADDDAIVVAQDSQGLFYEYSKAADPIRPSLTPRVPFRFFPASLHADGPTGIRPLDLSTELKTEGPATSPGLSANFVRVLKGEHLALASVATSMVFYVLKGEGAAHQLSDRFAFAQGDFFTFPGTADIMLIATEDTTLYYVDDAPLLRYLGVRPVCARFQPTIYKADRANAELARVASDPAASHRSRVSLLLGNTAFPLTRTVTHTLWAMYGLIGAGSIQRPHRHQSIALDLIVDCAPGVYTLVGRDIDADGTIVNPVRVDWEPGCAFVTPPGYWHAHYNTSGSEARLIPIQDAGLQTYLRSLDIRFA